MKFKALRPETATIERRNMIDKMLELVKLLKSENVTSADVAKKVREALSPELLLFVKAETTTPESILLQIKPLAGFLGPDVLKLLESGSTKKIIAEALVLLRKE